MPEPMAPAHEEGGMLCRVGRLWRPVGAVVLLSVLFCGGASLLHEWWASQTVRAPQTSLDRFGVKLAVNGGVIRSASERGARIWACVPEPSFTVQRASQDTTSYALRVLNVQTAALRLRTDMQARLQHLGRTEAILEIAFDDDRPHEIACEYPAETKARFSFGMFSDTSGRDAYAVLPPVMRDFASRQVRFVFSVGDTVGQAGYRLRTRWGVRLFDAYIRMAQTPVYYVIGDNDLAGHLADSALPWTSQYGPNNRSFSFGSAHFVILDSSWRTLSEHTLQWLAEDLERAKGQQSFIFMHVPPFDPRPDRNDGLRDPAADRFMDVVGRYPGTHIYSGHLQIRADWERAGCLLHITGTAGERVRDANPGPNAYSRVVAEYDQGRVTNIRVSDGLPGPLSLLMWRLRFVYPIWLAAHAWEAVGSLAASVLLVVSLRRRRCRDTLTAQLG